MSRRKQYPKFFIYVYIFQNSYNEHNGMRLYCTEYNTRKSSKSNKNVSSALNAYFYVGINGFKGGFLKKKKKKRKYNL